MTLPATLSNTMSLSTVSLTGLPRLWMYVGMMHIHVLVFICTYRGTCVCIHVHEDVWWCQLFSPIALNLTLWERVSQWTWDSADGQDWLVRELQRSTYLYNPPQHWDYRWMPPVLMWVLEIWTQVLMLAWWELCQLSQSQPPVLLLSATIFIQTGLTQFGISFFLCEARIPYRNLSALMRSSIPGLSL